MAKTGLLSPFHVQRETKPGRYCDGGGLYLQIRPTGSGDDDGKPLRSRLWLFRYSFDGQPKMMSLGAFSTTNSLAVARKRAEGLRALLDTGIDPQLKRDAEREERRQQEASAMTFEQGVKAFMAMRPDHWKNEKRKTQWLDLLERYAFPIIGKDSIQAVDEGRVLAVLQQDVPAQHAKKSRLVLKPAGPLWIARPETAAKIRNRMELVFDWARSTKKRTGENPARWRGNLDHSLGKNPARRRRKHYPALPYKDAPAFLAALREREDEIAACALEFVIFTTTRTNETLGARLSEIDDANAVWTIPGARMKSGRDHRVPLCAQALAALQRAKKLRRGGEFIFPGRKPKRPLSDMALLALLRRMGRSDITVHGMRSSFRDWAAEETTFPREIAELQIAHTVADDTEGAYWRSDMLEKRRALVAAWGEYCERPAGYNIVKHPRAVA